MSGVVLGKSQEQPLVKYRLEEPATLYPTLSGDPNKNRQDDKPKSSYPC